MNVWRFCKAYFKIAVAMNLEYRAAVVIWMLAGITPLIMMFVWRNLAAQGEIEGRGPDDFALYFLIAFFVTQCTQAWVVWNVDYLVRSGAYAIQLLRPFNPWFAELIDNFVSNGFRLPLNILIVAIGLWLSNAWPLIDPSRLPAFVLAVLLAWQLAFNISYALALVGLWTERIKAIDTWNYIMLFALGGALFPLEFLDPALRTIINWTPYPWIVGLPVSIMTGTADLAHGFSMQILWIALSVSVHLMLWRRGLKHFGAVGG
jgi:ABC-2 type transport system permease protein